jgi:hypothetical protein
MNDTSKQCPKCGSTKVASILYGLPIFDARLERELEAGETVLGGCCVSTGSPTRRCNSCGHNWGSLNFRYVDGTEKNQ